MYAQENSNQIFLRTVNSAGTNAEWYVAGSTSTPGSPYNVEWNNFNGSLFTCPADDPGGNRPGLSLYALVPEGLQQNRMESQRIFADHHRHHIRQGAMPTATPTCFNYGGVSAVSDELLNPAKNINVQQDLDRRHMGTGNVLFLGGHVEAHNWQDYALRYHISDKSGPEWSTLADFTRSAGPSSPSTNPRQQDLFRTPHPRYVFRAGAVFFICTVMLRTSLRLGGDLHALAAVLDCGADAHQCSENN